MGTSEAALKQMSKPNRTVVTILEKNWPRIRESCNYFEEGKNCPLTERKCEFRACPLLENEKNEGEERNEQSG